MRPFLPLNALVACGLSWALAGCAIPVRTVPAEAPPARADTLVIVLPGWFSDADTLAEAGVAEAIQSVTPDADVMLAGATTAYYLDGRVAARIREQLVLPARRDGYKKVWLVGASMGGRNALLYERQYPGDVDGLLLLAPMLDDREVVREVMAAGGPRFWDPGPRPERVNGDNYEHELWRMAKNWGRRPELAKRVWVACGRDDRLNAAARALAQQLPKGHYLERAGGHNWDVWSPATREVFARSAALRTDG